jgi:hypothetical protein
LRKVDRWNSGEKKIRDWTTVKFRNGRIETASSRAGRQMTIHQVLEGDVVTGLRGSGVRRYFWGLRILPHAG